MSERLSPYRLGFIRGQTSIDESSLEMQRDLLREIDALETENVQLRQQVEALVEALEWYADERNHDDTGPIGNRLDYGGKARDALAAVRRRGEGDE